MNHNIVQLDYLKRRLSQRLCFFVATNTINYDLLIAKLHAHGFTNHLD